ncbi:MAG: carboxypeptidase regulatory-like domain-containing protein, partial [Deltaproteobacteria bacterium]|nr:carboxypeptidase regulatory-like domain-containing protein [Deltaproteobacteria bacterium]
MRRSFSRASLFVYIILLGQAEAAVLSGLVQTSDKKPLPGAMVTAIDSDDGLRTTVYTDAAGHYHLRALKAQPYQLHTRLIGFSDETSDIDLSPQELQHDIVLKHTDRIAEQLPANYWFARIPFPDQRAKEEFARQCTSCHQQGSLATRRPRSEDEWQKIFDRMAMLGGVLSPELRRTMPALLRRGYSLDERGASFSLPAPLSPEAAGATITEWEIGGPYAYPHDVAVAKDGRVYSVDLTRDQLVRLDPRSGERKSWHIPPGDSPVGGLFPRLSPPGSSTEASPHLAPHSLQLDATGSVWITLCLGNKLARFDTRTERFRIWDQPAPGLYPQTLRLDRQGRVWYTLAVSNHIGRFDPTTEQFTLYRLPARSWGEAFTLRTMRLWLWLAQWLPTGWISAEAPVLPAPYGLDIAPDGSVWFSQLNAGRIGRLDPGSGNVQLYDTPFDGPRRLRFDAQGILWIPAFGSGSLARFDPQLATFKLYPLPTLPVGSDTPYALNVDRRTGMIWVCGTNSDSLIRFAPQKEKFTVFPLPTRVTFTREIDFDDEGNVWTSSSNSPTWHIEDGQPK